jgi:hypothetical protein
LAAPVLDEFPSGRIKRAIPERGHDDRPLSGREFYRQYLGRRLIGARGRTRRRMRPSCQTFLTDLLGA